jgi:hypothetical protein
MPMQLLVGPKAPSGKKITVPALPGSTPAAIAAP